MLLIIYIPVTREREVWGTAAGRAGERSIGRKTEKEKATSGTPGTASRGYEPPPPFPEPFHSIAYRTVTSAQKTRRFIAEERRENVDLSSYVQAWQFVCLRTLRLEKLRI